MRFTVLIACSLVSLQIAKADSKVNCEDPKGGYEESYCADQKYKAADKALNESFKKVKAKMSKEQAKLLLAAQKGWLQLRDNQCSLEVYAVRGTTGYNGQYQDCMKDLSEIRTKQLDSTPTDSTIK